MGNWGCTDGTTDTLFIILNIGTMAYVGLALQHNGNGHQAPRGKREG